MDLIAFVVLAPKQNECCSYSNHTTSNKVLPKPLILPPEGFHCEAAAGSAEEVFADKAQR